MVPRIISSSDYTRYWSMANGHKETGVKHRHGSVTSQTTQWPRTVTKQALPQGPEPHKLPWNREKSIAACHLMPHMLPCDYARPMWRLPQSDFHKDKRDSPTPFPLKHEPCCPFLPRQLARGQIRFPFSNFNLFTYVFTKLESLVIETGLGLIV